MASNTCRMSPTAYLFLSCQNRAFSTPLSFQHGKESAVDGRKKGWQRGNCVGTNSTSLILSAACGGQASSVPLFLLFPHESLRWIRVGALPLCNPLKTTKKGAAAPFLGFFPEFGSCRDRFRLAKRVTDAYLLNWRSSRNTLRLFRLLYVKYLPHFDFEMQKLPRPPEGRLDDGPCNDKTQNGTTRFFCA